MNTSESDGANISAGDEIPVEVWKCLGQLGVVTLYKPFNIIITTECIPSAW